MDTTSFLTDEKQSQTIRLFLNLAISLLGSILLYKIMPKFKDMFLKADLKGIDMSKKEKYYMYNNYYFIFFFSSIFIQFQLYKYF
jgi:hypothetical protein